MALKRKIGGRIRALRQSQYPVLSIHRLAVLAEVDPGQLSRAERGLAGLSLDALERIAAALNASLGTLVDPESESSHIEAAEPDTVRPYDEYHRLVHNLVRLVWAKLPEEKLAHYGDAEQDLIRHHIHSAIEEGVKRGHLLAEREIKAIRETEKETGSETN
ncbi:MAG: helix-turn-helix transcriptional regulator [Mariprofundaceae bacterium]|nr:helix-turn-helix transcriptional regulator [Mariprofundaceae bacterium]